MFLSIKQLMLGTSLSTKLYRTLHVLAYCYSKIIHQACIANIYHVSPWIKRIFKYTLTMLLLHIFFQETCVRRGVVTVHFCPESQHLGWIYLQCFDISYMASRSLSNIINHKVTKVLRTTRTAFLPKISCYNHPAIFDKGFWMASMIMKPKIIIYKLAM